MTRVYTGPPTPPPMCGVCRTAPATVRLGHTRYGRKLVTLACDADAATHNGPQWAVNDPAGKTHADPPAANGRYTCDGAEDVCGSCDRTIRYQKTSGLWSHIPTGLRACTPLSCGPKAAPRGWSDTRPAVRA